MKTKSKRMKDRFLELAGAFPLRPIRTEAEHGRAMDVYKELVFQSSSLSSGEKDYMETLLLLVSDYEKKHAPALPKVEPIELLKFLMHERGMTISGLGEIIGSQPAASMILSGRRGLSKANVGKFAEYFGVNAGLVL